MKAQGLLLFAILLPVAFGFAPPATLAQTPADSTSSVSAWPNHLYDKFQLTAATSLVLLNTNMRVDDADGESGTEIDLEEDLGLETVTLEPRFALRYRPGKRHEIEVGYLLARRKGEKAVADTISFADTTFTAGARLRTTFDSDYLFATYRFSFMAKDNTQIGAGLGLGAYFLKVNIDALPDRLNEGDSDSTAYGASVDFLAPTASLGAYGRFRLGEKWYLESDARVLALKIERLHARVFDINGALRYYPWSTWGFEAGYDAEFVKLDVDPKSPDSGDLINLEKSALFKFSTQNVRLGLIKTF